MTFTYLVFYLGINQLSCYAGGKNILKEKKSQRVDRPKPKKNNHLDFPGG